MAFKSFVEVSTKNKYPLVNFYDQKKKKKQGKRIGNVE